MTIESKTLSFDQKIRICEEAGRLVSVLDKKRGEATLGVVAGYDEKKGVLVVRGRRGLLAPADLIETGEATNGRLRFRIMHEEPFIHRDSTYKG